MNSACGDGPRTSPPARGEALPEPCRTLASSTACSAPLAQSAHTVNTTPMLRISGKDLGALAMPDFCKRHAEHHL